MDWSGIFRNALQAGVGSETIIYGLAAIGLNLHFGYAGLLNFGQAAFVAVGAYGIAVTVTTFGLPFFVGVGVGILGAVVLALLLGIPTLRLRADYLAIATIAAAEIVRLVFRSVSLNDITGGSDGLQGFDTTFYNLSFLPEGTYGFWYFRFSERTWWVLLVGWSLVILFSVMVFLLMRSPWGRVLKGIREDEDAVRSLGKNVYLYKMQALILGGVIGAFAGFIFALSRAAVQPDLYSTELTFFVYTILLLGGAARVLGPVVGAAIFWVVLSLTENVLAQAVRFDKIPDAIISGPEVGTVRFMLVGLALMALMIFRPQGIFGDKREIAINAR